MTINPKIKPSVDLRVVLATSMKIPIIRTHKGITSSFHIPTFIGCTYLPPPLFFVTV